jgi:hypothetical protein
MALVGKWTKIEQVESKTETEIVTIKYPSAEVIGEDSNLIDKAGTTEQKEVPVQEMVYTVYDNAYAVIHSLNSWKHIFKDETKSMFNITYRVYESKQHRTNDYNSYLKEDFIVSQEIDYTLKESEIQQAYNLLKQVAGCEELIND